MAQRVPRDRNESTTAGVAPESPPHQGVAALSEMDARHIGHLRHIENLSTQPDGDWSHMGTKMYGQEDFGAYRFQLAFMAYALALAHVHRAPNAPGAFRATFDRLIQKMLHPDVWMYWRNVSQGGHALNAHLRGGLGEEWDPVVRDNIMFSAYVHSMTLLYNVLFDDDKYAKAGAITFEHVSHFWGDGPKRFAYDQNQLNEHLYWKMVESGYLGIACEPNCVFQICNQPAILGFRLHDILNGTDRAADVATAYKKTWAEFGSIGENGHFNILVTEDNRQVIPNAGPVAWVDGWTGALMNTWNRDFVRTHYKRQLLDVLIAGEDGAFSVKLTPPPGNGGRVLDYDIGDFGFVAIWASELGDVETLEGLLRHAERHMAPIWSKGGYFFPRQDQAFDAAGHLTRIEPITGNALLAYAALNIPDGMWGIYNRPWGRAHFLEPLITEISGNVDVLKACYDEAARQLAFTLSPRADRDGPASLTIDNVFATGRGTWTLRAADATMATGDDKGVGRSGEDSAWRSNAALILRFELGRRTAFTLTWT